MTATDYRPGGTARVVSGTEFTGTAPVAVDGVTAAALATLPDGEVNGFVVKVNGPSAGYGRGQGFMVLEEGAGDATLQSAEDSVLWRVDENGGMGMTGGVHIATGLKKSVGAQQAVWIDPAENIVPLVINNPSSVLSATWDKDFLQIVDARNANEKVFSIASTGAVLSRRDVVARDGDATRVITGNVFGFAGFGLGSTADTILVRTEAKMLHIGAASFEFVERADPGLPVANRVRIDARDNGAGKTQLVARFPTGAVQVLATEP